jgi:hypothetical protein
MAAKLQPPDVVEYTIFSPVWETSIMSSSHPNRLLMACQKNQINVVQELLEEGIDPCHANIVAQSASHIAAWWARADILELLLQKKEWYCSSERPFQR